MLNSTQITFSKYSPVMNAHLVEEGLFVIQMFLCFRPIADSYVGKSKVKRKGNFFGSTDTLFAHLNEYTLIRKSQCNCCYEGKVEVILTFRMLTKAKYFLP